MVGSGGRWAAGLECFFAMRQLLRFFSNKGFLNVSQKNVVLVLCGDEAQ